MFYWKHTTHKVHVLSPILCLFVTYLAITHRLSGPRSATRLNVQIASTPLTTITRIAWRAPQHRPATTITSCLRHGRRDGSLSCQFISKQPQPESCFNYNASQSLGGSNYCWSNEQRHPASISCKKDNARRRAKNAWIKIIFIYGRSLCSLALVFWVLYLV